MITEISNVILLIMGEEEEHLASITKWLCIHRSVAMGVCSEKRRKGRGALLPSPYTTPSIN
jgi:hypothetical protein